VDQVELVIEAFRWSLALLSKIMMRTISEGRSVFDRQLIFETMEAFQHVPAVPGSTLVMKAINANQKFQLKKAMEAMASKSVKIL